jgi:phage shock protein A
MDEQMAALAKEVHDLRERQLQDRHESILRDDVILRRISVYDQRLDLHSEYLKEALAAISRSADITTKLGESLSNLRETVSILRDEINALSVRMDKTDQRWNQLIDQLTREHRNGGKKR